MGAPVPVRAMAAAATANYRADGGRSADFVVLACSVAGTAHRLGGGRCEDAYAWVKPRPGHLGLVIADGVSTAGRGGEGADLAVAAAARYLSEREDWGVDECWGAVERASDHLATAGRASARLRRQNFRRRSSSPWSRREHKGREPPSPGSGTAPVSCWTRGFGANLRAARER